MPQQNKGVVLSPHKKAVIKGTTWAGPCSNGRGLYFQSPSNFGREEVPARGLLSNNKGAVEFAPLPLIPLLNPEQGLGFRSNFICFCGSGGHLGEGRGGEGGM